MREPVGIEFKPCPEYTCPTCGHRLVIRPCPACCALAARVTTALLPERPTRTAAVAKEAGNTGR